MAVRSSGSSCWGDLVAACLDKAAREQGKAMRRGGCMSWFCGGEGAMSCGVKAG